MTSQPGKQTIAIHILPSISRRKGNQAMKFGQLIEYNMRNIFVKKSLIKCAVETIPRPLLLTNIKLFKKTKSDLELVSLPHFLHNIN